MVFIVSFTRMEEWIVNIWTCKMNGENLPHPIPKRFVEIIESIF